MALAVLGFVLLIVVPILLAQLLAGAQRSASRMQWMAMEEEFSIEPEQAYKTAQVLVAQDLRDALFSGVTEGSAYHADADAECRRPNCEPPGIDCVCGFYAFRSYDEAHAMLGRTLSYYGVRPTALLTVELDGDVLEYERGYRAAHQRVTEVAFVSTCDLCERFGDRTEAVALAASSTFVPRRMSGLGRPTVTYPEGYLPVRPVCETHLPADPASWVLDPGELSTLLGADVRWLTPPGQSGVAA